MKPVHVHPASSVVVKQVGDELVLLDYGRGMYYGLDPIGARIWELLGEGLSVDEVVNTLTSEYDVTRDEAGEDVQRLLAELTEKGLVVAT